MGKTRTATYGNPENTNDPGSFGSHTLDFIFVKSNREDMKWSSKQMVKDKEFKVRGTGSKKDVKVKFELG